MGFKYEYDAFAVLPGGYQAALFQAGPSKMTTQALIKFGGAGLGLLSV